MLPQGWETCAHILPCLSLLPLLSYLCLYLCTFTSHFSVTAHICLPSLSFSCLLYVSSPFPASSWLSLYVFSVLTTSVLPFTALPSSSSFPSAAVWRCNPGGVSSGQSYPSAQYESGLQQRGQQGEQPGHQPRTLLHTPRWVAVADRYPGGMCGKIRMSKTSKKEKKVSIESFLYHMRFMLHFTWLTLNKEN